MSKQVAVPVVPMQILKIGTSSSISGKSQLTYHIGCGADGAILLKVVASSGSGSFNSDAVPLSLIETLISEHPATKPLTSGSIRSVFRHRSSNSHGYLWAILKAESLVRPVDTKDGGYQLGDIDAFKQAITALIASDTDLGTPVEVAAPSDIAAAAKPKRTAKA